MHSLKRHAFFRKNHLLLGALLVLLISTYSFAQSTPQTNLSRATLTTGGHQIDVQLAQSPYEWSKGLMWRTSMPENEGMLFIFDQPTRQCFWMKNTYLPLSAAFIADDGSIVNIADMRPLSTQEHCSEKPVRFVLEVHQGWFQKNNIEAGDIVSDVTQFIH